MSIKYDSRREPLSEVIKKATVNATYVIPDLQRSYVWTPRQVTLLIDSLFRGWPFGSLLLWEVRPDCFQADEGIPHRPFWEVVDRTNNDRGTPASSLGNPATYQMVLDGQQRIQSLILALGGDQWGFQLYDADWSLDLLDRRVRPSNHWSKASLCLDLQKFRVEWEDKGKKVRKIEAGKILEWSILDATSGQSVEPRPANYVYPLLSAKENPGRFIRLSRLWDLVQKDLSESEYVELLRPILKEHGVGDKDLSELLLPLAEFMKVVENVKTNSFVHALQIESFQLTPQWSKDDYTDAIVNIFTRLNTAGRTLTREEITLAWLKVGWILAETDNITAGQCLEELKSALGDRGFHLETDDIVRLISFIWAVEHRGGKLLDSKDLLKGEIVRPMAKDIATEWKKMKLRIEAGADTINERSILENQGSFNALIVFFTWYRLVFDRLETLYGLPVVESDSLEKKLNERAATFLDRWVFGSQWANVWGDAAVLNFQNYATDLNDCHTALKGCDSVNFIDVVDKGITELMSRISTKALDQINNIVVRDRTRVHTYYPFLWVWHRLDDERWKNSSIAMRTGRRRTGKLEVDHTVADAWWKRLINKEIESKLATFNGADEDRVLVAPDGFESRDEAFTFINSLGNCSLLDKSFNVSKSDEPMWTFLQEVREFKEGIIKRDDWEEALSLSKMLTSPDGATLVDIKSAIENRDALIREDLRGFVSGNKHRVDVVG